MSESRGNNPNIDPADNDTLVGTLRFVFNQLTRNVDGMLPARVLAYDRTANRVQVQIMIAMVSTSGAQVSRAQIANIPVVNFGGGGYILNFPLMVGDLGFVMANDRDISLFLQSYEESPPNTLRVKSFSDAVFIPSVLSNYTTTGQDGNAVLQNLDGTVRISLSPNTVELYAKQSGSPPNEYKVTVSKTGITITSVNTITLDSPLTHITGTLQIDGGATIAGSLAAFPGYSVFLTGGNLYTTGFIKASGAITPSSPP
jgi:Phage protein Gp138 N-terminal domain